ncbi:uncharacterized protein DS421_14g466210 [Arachis hypogaea]|nr:uncharacterized protein DS421_14g466210 [Arachis hypogaea]
MQLPLSYRRFIRVTVQEETWQMMLWWWRNYGGRHWILLLLKGVQFHSLMWRNKNLLCQGGQGQKQEQLRPCNCYICNCLPSINQNGGGGGGAISDQSAINGGGGAVLVALVFNQNAVKIDSNEYIWWKANARETKEELIDRELKFLD